MQRRIGTAISAYEAQGFHRTGTAVDQVSGDWLANEVRQIGPAPVREEFPLSRVDPVAASLVVNDRKIEGLPLFDGGFTSSAGIAGSLGSLDGDASIGLAEIAPRPAHWVTRADKIGIRRSSSSRAARALDFAPAMPTAFGARLARRCCRFAARRRRSWPIGRDRARRRC